VHIPDGYLSPLTSGSLWVIAAPLWALSLRTIRRTLRRRFIPLLAILAAFSFLIMMFNVPLPGGTTGHAVGAVLVAILVGPWPALMAVTIALAVQALLFGDGGILALGANAFNMGFLMPFAGYLVFRAIAGSTPPGTRRFSLAAAAGGYVGINVAAFFVAIELGVQPILHHLPDGTPLYCPFSLSMTLPAMMLPHLTIGGAAEAILTGGVAAFLGKYHPELFEARLGSRATAPVVDAEPPPEPAGEAPR
jgi:cobalt/nickel transport system permease protein